MNRSAEVKLEQPASRLTWVGLGAILAAYCVLATAQSYATRLQWGPDEPAHIIYVQSLALDGRLPAIALTETEDAYLPGAARTHQAHHPPLYYALAAGLWRIAAGLPDQTVSYRDRATGRLVSFAVPGPVRPVRFFSVALGALSLLLAWATARTIFPDRADLCLAGVALAAFTPMFTYVHGVVNNDPLLICAFAGTAWQWARILRFGASRREVLVLGLLIGVAINTKETALGLLPLSLVVLALEPGATSWRQRLARMGAVVAAAAVLAGWWYARKWALYGRPMAYAYYAPLLGLPDGERQARLLALPGSLFLFTFAPADVILPHANLGLIARVFGGLAVLSSGGLAMLLLRAKARPIPRFQAECLGVWLLAAAVLVIGWARNVLYVDWRMGTAGGRFLQPVVPLVALVAARGLSALFGDGKWSRAGVAGVCALLVAMNAYAIWATAAGYGALGR